MFDTGPYNGDPDLASASSGPVSLCGTTGSVSYSPADGAVTAGLWYAAPSPCGPYSNTAPLGGVATVSMTAQTKEFDPAVTSSTGDLWLISTNASASFSPVVINPGQTATVAADGSFCLILQMLNGANDNGTVTAQVLNDGWGLSSNIATVNVTVLS